MRRPASSNRECIKEKCFKLCFSSVESLRGLLDNLPRLPLHSSQVGRPINRTCSSNSQVRLCCPSLSINPTHFASNDVYHSRPSNDLPLIFHLANQRLQITKTEGRAPSGMSDLAHLYFSGELNCHNRLPTDMHGDIQASLSISPERSHIRSFFFLFVLRRFSRCTLDASCIYLSDWASNMVVDRARCFKR